MSNEPRARKAKLHSPEHEEYVNRCMTDAPDMSAKELRDKIRAHFNLEVSATAATRYRRRLGWTQHNTHYCQMIREANKEKRLEWSNLQLQTQERFDVSTFFNFILLFVQKNKTK